MEQDFQKEYEFLKSQIPRGILSQRFLEQLCYRFYILGKKSKKVKKGKIKESLKIITKL